MNPKTKDMIMSILTKKVSWQNWQFGVFKLSMVALGILLGVYFTAFWRNLLWLVWIVFVITIVWVSIMWLKAVSLGKK